MFNGNFLKNCVKVLYLMKIKKKVKMKYFILFFVLILSSCKSKILDIKKTTISGNKIDLVELAKSLKSSHFNSINQEKLEFKSLNISNANYLSILNFHISEEIENQTTNTEIEYLKESLKDFNEEEIKEIYVLSMTKSNETISEEYFIILRYKNYYDGSFLYVYDNLGSKRIKKSVDNELITNFDEYRLNLNYSFYNKSLYNNNPQSFFIDKIVLDKSKIISVHSKIALKMLVSQEKTLINFLSID